MTSAPSFLKPSSRSSSVDSTCAIWLGVRNFVFVPSSVICRKYALQPSPSTSTSYAAPSPELYIPQMKSGSLSSRRSSQPSKPGTVADSGVSGCVEYFSSVQSACGRLCQGHHTVIPAIIADTTADPAEIHADQSIIALAS